MPRRRRSVVGPRRAPPRPDAASRVPASRPRAAAAPRGHGSSGHGSSHGGSGVPARVPIRGSAMPQAMPPAMPQAMPQAMPSSREIMRRSEDTLALMQEGAPMEFHDSLGLAHNATHC